MKTNLIIKLITLSCIWSFSITTILAQISFTENTIAEQVGGHTVQHVDIDEDADDDLLVVSNSALIFLFNDGAGNFTRSILPNSNGVSAVDVMDIDSDGDLDIAVAANALDEIYWLENNGTEQFTKHLISTALLDARSIAAGDFNGDTFIDLVVSGYNDDEISWWQNDGNETFTKNLIDDVIIRPLGTTAIDMDNDNDLDIVAFSFHTSAIYWYRNTPTGFSKIFIANLPSITALDVKDINEDNLMDVVAIMGSGSNIRWYLNNSSNFVEHEIQDHNGLGSGEDILAKDLDKDGDLDILVGYGRYGHNWFENDGAENFTKHFLDFDLYGNSITATDLDNDTEIDLVYTDGYAIQWFKNDGTETYSEQNFIDNYLGFPNTIHATDMDNDGDIDLQTNSTFSASIGWWENNGNEEFSFKKIKNGLYSFLEVGDLDGDNDLDFVTSTSISGSSGGGFIQLENDGTNLNFTSESIQTYHVNAAAIADFDSDGDQDVASNRSNGELRWFSNDSSGNFTQNFISNNTGNTPRINLGDIDSDGDVDLIKFNSTDQRLQFHSFHVNSFGIGYPYIDNNLTSCSKIESVDLDGDGDLDVLATSSSLKDIIWYENDGSQNFTKHYIDENFTSANGLGAGDFDGDGDIDIIVGGITLSCFENDGEQNFTKHDITTYYCGNELFVEDVNDDGKLDIITGSCGISKTMVYWENESITPPPPNDNCAGAKVIPINEHVGSSNAFATTSMAPLSSACYPAASNYGKDLWFKFTPPIDMKLEIGVLNAEYSDLRYVFFTDNCGSLTSSDILTCGTVDIVNGGNTVLHTADFDANTTYYLQIWDDGNNETGTINLYTHLILDCPHPDYAALKALYESTNGQNWTNAPTWQAEINAPTCNPCSWEGVSCKTVNGEVRVYRLVLEYMNLTGPVPSEIGNLGELERLELQDNNLNGTIPTTIANLTKLERLNLRDNLLTGNVPPEFGNMNPNVIQLIYLHNNSLSGCLDANLKNLCPIKFSVILSGNVDLANFWDFCDSDTGTCGGSSGNGICHLFDLNLTEHPTKDTSYHSLTQITANIVIDSPLEVTMTASNTLIFQDDFHVKQGATFSAIIGDCVPTPPLTNNEIGVNYRTGKELKNTSIKPLDLIISPNPFSNQTNIQFTLNEPSPVQITLYNLNGQQVKTLIPPTQYTAGPHQLKITSENLPNGIYFLALQTATNKMTKKLIIQRQ